MYRFMQLLMWIPPRSGIAADARYQPPHNVIVPAIPQLGDGSFMYWLN